jgi:UDP-N-acetylmuramate dehydrogenase
MLELAPLTILGRNLHYLFATFCMTIEEHIPLAPYTTFGIGGPARYFTKIAHEFDIKNALAYAYDHAVPFFVLGGGSNILMSDEGYPGLVIKIEIPGIEIVRKEDTTEVIVGAGEHWDAFVLHTIQNNLRGLENLSGIPGTVGAAPVQNVGAYGVEVKDHIAWVEAYDPETERTVRFSNAACEFSYRHSFFKTQAGKQFIITRVAFVLSEKTPLNLSYKDIKKHLEEKGVSEITSSELRELILSIRARKLPDWREIGTAGSFFKNPIVEKGFYESLLARFPGMPYFSVSESHVKIPAAWLLDHIGKFNGVVFGNAGVYQNQALVIINRGGAHAQEINSLANRMTQKIFSETGIVLSREVENVGDF